jgi:nucleotide-binding universal stress UspA family protein
VITPMNVLVSPRFIPDFPQWAMTIAAAHGESVRAETQHAPQVLAAAASLREAIAFKADRIVLGSQGRGRAQLAVLGSTASAVAAEAPCTVHVARPRRAAVQAMPGAHAA